MKSLPVPVTFVAREAILKIPRAIVYFCFRKKKIVAVCSCRVHLRMLCVVVFEAVLEEVDALLGPDLVDADEVLGGRELEVLPLLVHLVGDLARGQLAAVETCGRTRVLSPNSRTPIISRFRLFDFSRPEVRDRADNFRWRRRVSREWANGKDDFCEREKNCR